MPMEENGKQTIIKFYIERVSITKVDLFRTVEDAHLDMWIHCSCEAVCRNFPGSADRVRPTGSSSLIGESESRDPRHLYEHQECRLSEKKTQKKDQDSVSCGPEVGPCQDARCGKVNPRLTQLPPFNITRKLMSLSANEN
ncbi:hypothetical protein AVEN_184097-1 [Araneus ventricosus]|uniref:Uncharacterized protein n=1 Tax=Araneus ventricosus TaxID=182803 RepID=A0A4Y2D098_ARAVE|nr:hypothetical protein AVEN_184097-1 [Araneus ventricosus]